MMKALAAWLAENPRLEFPADFPSSFRLQNKHFQIPSQA
jgi:hypothetical protein